MKHHPSCLYLKKLLPITLALTIVSGCGGDQLGGTNEGLAGASAGAGAALLIGGIVGVDAIIGSDSDDSGVVVQPTGGDADNGLDNTEDGNGADNTGGTVNDDDGSGNGDSAENDNDNNSNDGAEGNQVPFLQAPDWLLGMWTGTGSDGVVQNGFATMNDMGVNLAGHPLRGYSEISGVCFHILEDSDNAFVYTVWYQLPDGTEVLFNERWVNNSDGSVFYRASGAKNDEFIMHQTPATAFLHPPHWLQGRWATVPGDGAHVAADINAGNIVISENNDTLNHYNLAKIPGSVLQIFENNESTYSYKLTSVDSNGEETVVSVAFHNNSANTITYTRFQDDNERTVHLERQ